MLAIVLALVFLAIWWLTGRRVRFIDQFAQILEHGVVHRTPASALAGRSYATGTFRGREVAVRMQLRRSRHDQAYLVVAVRTGSDLSLPYAEVDARTTGEAGRRALAALAGQDLLVSVEDGWLKALWRPQGFTMFPTPFSADRWRKAVDSLTSVAACLDAEGR